MCQKAVEELQAVVTDIRGKPPNEYVVTRTLPSGEVLERRVVITFGLSAWKGSYPLAKSQMVILTGVQMFEGGWRAYSARPVVWCNK